MFDLDATIVAIGSAPGPAARGILRFSGPGTLPVLRQVWQFDPSTEGSSAAGPPAPDVDPWSIRVPLSRSGRMMLPGLPRGLPGMLSLWPTHRSYTGQPGAECHLPGIPPLLDEALAVCCQAGARLAQPGEFTLRAFLAGKLDLAQAEAVLGVIHADGPAELQAALEQLAGGLSQPVVTLRAELFDLLADLEAGLDFAHEEIEFVGHAELRARLQQAIDQLDQLLQRAPARTRSASLPRVVLTGPPNAGKSTLFNALLGTDRAIVSAQAGTTRDYLLAELDLDGVRLELVDTAGEEESAGQIEGQAQQFRRQQLQRSDLRLDCRSVVDVLSDVSQRVADQTTICVDTMADLLAAEEPIPQPVMSRSESVGGEHDLAGAGLTARGSNASYDPSPIAVSARTGLGLARLKAEIRQRLVGQSSAAREWRGGATVRTQAALRSAREALQAGYHIAQTEGDQVLLAEEIRQALDCLAEVVGAVYTEDLLGRIFSRFCIGK